MCPMYNIVICFVIQDYFFAFSMFVFLFVPDFNR